LRIGRALEEAMVSPPDSNIMRTKIETGSSKAPRLTGLRTTSPPIRDLCAVIHSAGLPTQI
jgi:hypothetical protein